MANYRVMGIAEDPGYVGRVVQDLKTRGFAEADISVLYPSPQQLAEDSDQKSIAKGAAGGATTGGTIGGVLAGLASFALPGIGPVIGAGILGTAMAGAAAGGVLGAFSQIGLADDLAASYQESLEQGDTIFAIETPDPDRAADAEHTLREHNFSLVNTFQV
jgi:hypothetical protein